MSALVEAILRDIREGADESRALNEPGGTASWGKEHGILLTRDAAESLFAEVARLRAQVVRAASVRSDGVTLVLNFDNYGRQRDALLALTATTPAEG